jgi:hypothetical protein
MELQHSESLGPSFVGLSLVITRIKDANNEREDWKDWHRNGRVIDLPNESDGDINLGVYD